MANSVSSAPVKPTPTKRRSTPTPKSKPLDFSKGVVGKYYERAIAAKNVVVIDADLLDTFPDAAAVNTALRTLKDVATRSAKRPARQRSSAA